MSEENCQVKDIAEIKERLTRIETLLENTVITRKLELDKISAQIDANKNEAEYKNHELEHRIEKVENSNLWVWRTVLGVIIGAILKLIITH